MPKVQLTKEEKQTAFNRAKALIRKWQKPYFGAVPYISAIMSMSGPEENYGLDSGKSIVIYFLGNATTWRGDEAKEAKQLLKAIYEVK